MHILFELNEKKLKNHIKLCKRNLRNNAVKCCKDCPFEEIIIDRYPELKKGFKEKRSFWRLTMKS